jgi:hypothetical protein
MSNHKLANLLFGVGMMSSGKFTGPWYRAGGAPAPIAVWQPKGAASSAAALVNLVNPGTYDAFGSNQATWNALGWVGNSSQKSFRTGLAFPQNGSAFCCWTNASGTANSALMGSNETGKKFVLRTKITTGTQLQFLYANLQLLYTITPPAAGSLALAKYDCYLNGQNIGTLSGADAVPTWEVVLMGVNTDNANPPTVSPGFYNGYWCAGAIWDARLTDAQMQAVHNAAQASGLF